MSSWDPVRYFIIPDLSSISNTIPLWRLSGDEIVSEDMLCEVEHDSCAISSNGEYYSVLHRDNNAITILDAFGRQVLKATFKEACGKEIKMGWDLHVDKTTNDIYVVC